MTRRIECHYRTCPKHARAQRTQSLLHKRPTGDRHNARDATAAQSNGVSARQVRTRRRKSIRCLLLAKTPTNYRLVDRASGTLKQVPPTASTLLVRSGPTRSSCTAPASPGTSSMSSRSSDDTPHLHEPLAPPVNSFANASTTTKALTPHRQLGELLRSIDPKYCFHPAVEELLLDMASDFVQDVVEFSGQLAKHRRSTTVEPRDLQFCLAKNYGISLAGVLPTATSGAKSASALRPLGQDLLVRARPAKSSLHMHRMARKRTSVLHTKTKLKTAQAVKATEGSRKVVCKASSVSK